MSSLITWNLPGPAITNGPSINIIAADASATTFVMSCPASVDCGFDTASYTVGPWAGSGQGNGEYNMYLQITDAELGITATTTGGSGLSPESLSCTISNGVADPCTVIAAVAGITTSAVTSLGSLGPKVFTVTAGADRLSASNTGAASSEATGSASSEATGSSTSGSASKTTSGTASATSSAASSTGTSKNAASSDKPLKLSAIGVLGLFAAMIAL